MIRVIWWTVSGACPALESAISGMHITAVRSVPELLMFCRNALCDIVIAQTDAAAAQTDDMLLEVLRVDSRVPVIIVTSNCNPEDAVRLVRLGAFGVVEEGFGSRGLADSLQAASELVSQTRSTKVRTQERWRTTLVGNSDVMSRVVDIIRLVAARRSTVLITGETGTGKEVVARAIHVAGGREQLPFVAVNCSAIPENLVESELFGYVKGAFTGAHQTRTGKFEQAQGGTIFLDEIGELQPEVQAKLLRVLQEREIQRLGGSETIKLNVRVIAATNQNLLEAVRSRRFREDLFYRLNVVPLHLPPLRERSDDIPELVEHFLDRICRAESLDKRRVTSRALALLVANSWPGNIRQLEHAIEMAVVLSGDRRVLDSGDFPTLFNDIDFDDRLHRPGPMLVPDEGLDFEEAVSQFERSILQQALMRCNGNKARAAQLLRMKRTTLLARIKSLECEPSGVCA